MRGSRCAIRGLVWVAATVTLAACAQHPAPEAVAPPPAEAVASSPEITNDIELTRAAIQARRQALVTSAMDLTPDESRAFWPVYHDYRTEMAAVNDRFVELVLTYLENYDTLTDELAGKLLDEFLAIEKARLEVKEKHVPRFRAALSPRTVARFFQVDNKLDKLVDAELAIDVPLVR